ncbi:hypothetical protein A2886_02530 [candidate division WWE3 bacterium RIFCSPHIGHO2_01_FULL_42_13]|uniref:Large ribosomal subunit protein bL35 n=1 Tax=candidate division WWE3 bacterium RIFCSPHIGHO2_01_FULL_42_13 TaxID=1802617 RepID=A0A1F4URN2_UNCKA|nr:MAG: hypothetical protein A2886_02530 [candidate division WWE3 bacterium RIFCSPHIGHO2_01_FULL_42_13]
MPKTKTNKTAKKRMKITKSGKILTKQIRTGHLKSKWSTNKRFRKNTGAEVSSVGYKKILKSLLKKSGKGIKI